MRLAVILCAAAAAAYVPLALYLLRGMEGVFALLAPDSFYYLTVARRSLGRPFFTFDGSLPTNGFHPLWQYYLAALAAHGGRALTASALILENMASSVLLTATGTALFARALLALTGRPALSLLAAVPGLYAIPLLAVAPGFTTQWSFANGMESCLSVFGFGLLFRLLLAGGPRRGDFADGPGRAPLDRAAGQLRRGGWPSPVAVAGLSLLLTFLTLSRLDDVFLFVPFLLVLAVITPRESRLRVGCAALLPPLLLIGAYLLYNWSGSGMLLPVSGTVKRRGALWDNYLWALAPLSPFSTGLDDPLWSEQTYRSLQMLVPLLAATVWLAGWWRRSGRPGRDARAGRPEEDSQPGRLERDPPQDRPIGADRGVRHRPSVALAERLAGSAPAQTALAGLALYVILKGLYNLLFVELWNQGFWYYAGSLMVVNALAAESIARRLAPAQPAASPAPAPGSRGWRAALLLIAAALYVVLLGNAVIHWMIDSHHHADYYALWSRAPAIERELERLYPGAGIVEADDGIFGFSFSRPTLSGFGYALDREAARAMRQGSLPRLARARGYRLVATLYRKLPYGRWRDWGLVTVGRDPVSGASFMRFSAPPDPGRGSRQR